MLHCILLCWLDNRDLDLAGCAAPVPEVWKVILSATVSVRPLNGTSATPSHHSVSSSRASREELQRKRQLLWKRFMHAEIFCDLPRHWTFLEPSLQNHNTTAAVKEQPAISPWRSPAKPSFSSISVVTCWCSLSLNILQDVDFRAGLRLCCPDSAR